MSGTDLPSLITWRQHLHTMPELSGEEEKTAAEVVAFLSQTKPDALITGLGGTGVAVIYEGVEPGPTIAIRAELDALPIEETGTPPYRSKEPGKGHMCGHDGHMTILAAVGQALGAKRPKRGRAILLFQPSEENGAGAALMISDPAFAAVKPDIALSLHNMPGVPLGHVWLKEGTANCASLGLKITFTGKTAHASLPHTGLSPAPAIAELVPALGALSGGVLGDGSFTLSTITHITVGEPAFGIAPGHGELWVTLRTETDAGMAGIRAEAERLARDAAARHGLTVAFETHDHFLACVNHEEAVHLLADAMDAEGVNRIEGEIMRGSEDFGRFAEVSKSAMFFLGSGENHPALHNPDFDFPDTLIEKGAGIFTRAIRYLLG